MLLKQSLHGVEILSIDEEKIRALLKGISKKIKAKHNEVREVILFGSFSKKDFTPYSDIDIAIIVDETDKKFIKRADEFIDYFIEVPLDVNLIVYTAEEISKMVNAGNNFIKEIIIKGVRLGL